MTPSHSATLSTPAFSTPALSATPIALGGQSALGGQCPLGGPNALSVEELAQISGGVALVVGRPVVSLSAISKLSLVNQALLRVAVGPQPIPPGR